MLSRTITPAELWDGRHVWSWGTIDGLPAFRWGHVPGGLVTLSQLHQRGMQRRRGQEPYAVLVWRSRRFGQRIANLWRVDQAIPRQPFTPRRRAALTMAYLTRFRCLCGRELDHYARRDLCEHREAS